MTMKCGRDRCKYSICILKVDGQVLCIILSTILIDEPFNCPSCYHSRRTVPPVSSLLYTISVFYLNTIAMQYTISTPGSTFMARYSNLYPLTVYTLTIDPPLELYVTNTVINQLQEDYSGQTDDVSPSTPGY